MRNIVKARIGKIREKGEERREEERGEKRFDMMHDSESDLREQSDTVNPSGLRKISNRT